MSKSNISCYGGTNGSITVGAANGATHSGTNNPRTFNYRAVGPNGYDVTLLKRNKFCLFMKNEQTGVSEKTRVA